jgi:hypothetical protein
VPFVRFSHDRRGYDHIYLIHSQAGAGNASRAHILYWYRSPQGAKVGREPFDAGIRRALEARYPDLTFEWDKIVAASIVPPPSAVEQRPERRRVPRTGRLSQDVQGQQSATEPEIPAEPEPQRSQSSLASSLPSPKYRAVRRWPNHRPNSRRLASRVLRLRADRARDVEDDAEAVDAAVMEAASPQTPTDSLGRRPDMA